MIKSMTGFGKATVATGDKKMVIEIKSLNSKTLDASLRLPPSYKEKELEIRALVKQRLERGKIDLSIHDDAGERDVALNQPLLAAYFRQLLDVAAALDVAPDKGELLQAALRFPDVMQARAAEAGDEEWQALRRGLDEALDCLDDFRRREGEALVEDILRRVALIESLAAEVPRFEGQRVEVVRQRLRDKLEEWSAAGVDENRLEQELIYYIEKFDITEEKTRLAQHCRYFVDTARDEEAPGRKLGFIAQEIGREINTLGSKANDHDIQKLVVRMKDELEKIKEQTLNLL
ncbi:MAG: YicC family protein [Odoribacteraceae bacterium]|jgi:uncharacterized protein (TIGR00255 family)|nr:YicC family protein [Odoribacteraceae bacterium]